MSLGSREAFEEEPQMSKKRAAFIVAAVVVGILLVSFLVIFWLSAGEDEVVGTEPLSSSEEGLVQAKTEDFIVEIGNFGIDHTEFDSEVVNETNNPESLEFFSSRGDTYLEFRDEFISEDSDYYYSEARADGWDEDPDTGFTVEHASIEVNDISGASMLEVNEMEYRTVVVNVDWQSVEHHFEVVATDVSWDGSHDISQRTFDNSGVDIQFIETAQGWFVYDVSGLEEIRSTVLWREPSLTAGSDTELESAGTTEGSGVNEEYEDYVEDGGMSEEELDELIEQSNREQAEEGRYKSFLPDGEEEPELETDDEIIDEDSGYEDD